MYNKVCANNIIKDFRDLIGPQVKLNDVHRLLARYGCKPLYTDNKRGPIYQYNGTPLNGSMTVDNVLNTIYWEIHDGKFVFEYPKQTKPEEKKEEPIKKVAKPEQMQIQFVDENDDKLYESLFGKKIYITEEQARYISKNLLNEEHLITKIIQSCQDEDEYIKNDFDEKWKRIPTDSKEFKQIKNKLTFENKSKLGLYALAEVDGERYIGIIFGGLNGPGKWQNYLKDISVALSKVNGYLIDLDNDVLDDTWTLLFGFQKKKLNEGASGYEPEDSDAYFDMSYELSEKIFKNLLSKLQRSLKDKNDNMVYTYLGIINHMLQVKELLGPVYFSNKDLEKDKKIEGNPLAINILKVCVECYNYLFGDKENRQGWEDFDNYKWELKRQYDIFKNTMKMLNEDNEIEVIKPYHLHESKNFVDTRKVMIVKKYLDDNFVRAAMPTIGNDGYPKTLLIVGMKGTDGNIIKNMYAQQLFDLLQDKFQKIYSDKQKRDMFLKQVMKDWYDKKITKDGLLSINAY